MLNTRFSTKAIWLQQLLCGLCEGASRDSRETFLISFINIIVIQQRH